MAEPDAVILEIAQADSLLKTTDFYESKWLKPTKT